MAMGKKVYATFAIVSLTIIILAFGLSSCMGQQATLPPTISNPPILQFSVAPPMQWEHEYAGPGQVGDTVIGLTQTSDGGYAFAGTNDPYSYEGVVLSTYLVKTDSSGVMQWSKQFDYSSYNFPSVYGLVYTSDNGYVLAQANNDSSGIALIRLDANGNIEWNRTYDNTGCSRMIPTSDGGFVFAGTDSSKVWLLKTDSAGNVQWNKVYSAKFDRGVDHIIQAQDGSYLITGSSIIDPNFEGSPSTLVLLKTDSAGNLLWNQNYDVNDSSWDGHTMIQTRDGNFVIMDNTNTSVLVFKIDQNGTILWTQDYPAIGIIDSIAEVSDGELALAGINGGANTILRLAMTNSSGNLEWSITTGNLNLVLPFAGGLFYNSGSCLIESGDGSLVVAGIADNENPYQASAYLIKTQPFLPIPTSKPSFPVVPSTLHASPFPTNISSASSANSPTSSPSTSLSTQASSTLTQSPNSAPSPSPSVSPTLQPTILESTAPLPPDLIGGPVITIIALVVIIMIAAVAVILVYCKKTYRNRMIE